MRDTHYEAEFLSRPRVMSLLAEAVKQPLSIVLAGAGYGKTSAVYDFVIASGIPFVWEQFSERDNAGSRFWTRYIQNFSGWNNIFLEHCEALGFPDTADKLSRHVSVRDHYAPDKRNLVILDDIHLLRHPDILRYFNRSLRNPVKNISVILVCREVPDIGISDLRIRRLIPTITEDDLCFTDSELARFFSNQGLSVSKQDLSSILRDTTGWAFSVNLTAQSLKKSPGYEGYVRVAVRQNIFKLMEMEAYDAVSGRMRRFLVRLSLIDHLAADLIAELAEDDAELLADFKRQNAYIRYNGYINAYMIHHLFLEFLRSKQSILTYEEKIKTYRLAAKWCALHGFENDALVYYENVGDYGAIISILNGLPVQMPLDIAHLAAGIFERAPKKLADEIEYFAVMHIRVFNRLGQWDEAFRLIDEYTGHFLGFDEGDPFRNRTLGIIYYTYANLRELCCTMNGRYDFDLCYAKMDECLTRFPAEPDQYADLPLGFWVNLVGSSNKGAPLEYIKAEAKAVKHVAHCWRGAMSGLDIICEGELKYYQGDIKAAEALIDVGLRKAKENRLFEVEYKALLYMLRIALWHGDYKKCERLLNDLKDRLGEKNYAQRFFNYDIALALYYCGLRHSELIPAWLMENFIPYSHPYYTENTGNQIKARVHYLTRNYQPLLSYIEEVRSREAILYGRVEMLALEACVYYHMKDKSAAFGALRSAFETADPNGIIAPFVELGRDMRTLVSAALREPDAGIPLEWLSDIKRKSASFAKLQSLMIYEYEKTHGVSRGMLLSARESKILKDLYGGLSRMEIATKQGLSVNTVNSTLNSIFNKLGARNTVDAVRIAAEEKLV